MERKKKKWREINIFHDIKEGEIESYYTNYYFINIMKKKNDKICFCKL